MKMKINYHSEGERQRVSSAFVFSLRDPQWRAHFHKMVIFAAFFSHWISTQTLMRCSRFFRFVFLYKVKALDDNNCSIWVDWKALLNGEESEINVLKIKIWLAKFLFLACIMYLYMPFLPPSRVLGEEFFLLLVSMYDLIDFYLRRFE